MSRRKEEIRRLTAELAAMLAELEALAETLTAGLCEAAESEQQTGEETS
jgi:hypothetical protein